jgi:hypothetical protein
MTIKAILTPALSIPLTGEVELVQRPGLPRNDKKQLEMHIAATLVSLLPTPLQEQMSNLRSSPADPPDVLVEVQGKPVGIEVGELVPQNRLERDDILDRATAQILEGLVLGEHTRDRVVFLHLVDSYSEKLKLKNCAQTLVTLLNAELRRETARSFVIPVPDELRRLIHSISVETYDLRGHPQIDREIEPLIVFSAEATFIRPDEDFPRILSHTLARKLRHDLAQETWLLIWTDNAAMSGVREELCAGIKAMLASQGCQYSRVFLLTFGFKNEATEIDFSK